MADSITHDSQVAYAGQLGIVLSKQCMSCGMSGVASRLIRGICTTRAIIRRFHASFASVPGYSFRQYQFTSVSVEVLLTSVTSEFVAGQGANKSLASPLSIGPRLSTHKYVQGSVDY